MNITITRHSSKVTNEELHRATIFYTNMLLKPNISNKIYLEIDIRKMEKDVYAYCEWTDNSYRPKEFLITLNRRLYRNNLLRYLAHELVHLRQYATNQLFDYIDGNVRFCNQRYDPNNIEYRHHPWEIEAFALQDTLYQKFLKDLAF